MINQIVSSFKRKQSCNQKTKNMQISKIRGEKYLPCNIPITVDPTKIQIIKEYFEKIYPNH